MIALKKVLFILAILCSLLVQAQQVKKEGETPKKKEPMSTVKKATLLSLIPGGGQVYNKHYWKVPVIYVGFAALTYSYLFYNEVYNDVRQSYIQKINKEPVTNPEYANVPEEMLYSLRETYRKSRDLSVIGFAGLYVFNLVDAAVDAHLKGFDVGDQLSMRIKPDYHYSLTGPVTGVQISLRFK